MQDYDKLYLRIKNELEKKSNLETEAILEELTQSQEEAIKMIEVEVKNEIDDVMQKEMSAFLRKMRDKEVKQNESQQTSLVQKRNEMIQSVFDEAKEKLETFVKSTAYKDFLISHIDEAIKENNFSHYMLYIRKEDESLVSNYAYTISNQIKIGGFILQNEEGNIKINQSLDQTLENQKEWFYEVSHLMIK